MEFLERIVVFELSHFPFILLALLFAFTLHEFAHAYSAYKFGDPTAKDLGRVTLNPMAHLDIFGTILIFIVGFGWAKPVPVDRRHFKHPRVMGIVVSALGPLSNLLIAFAGMIAAYILVQTGAMADWTVGTQNAVSLFFYYLITLNLLLFIFNLLPLPPLDGYRIVEDLAPVSVRVRMFQFERWAIFIFLLLVFIPPLRRVTIEPVFSLSGDVFILLDKLLQLFFGASARPWDVIFRVF
jgi:Zn-dependent protease